MPTTHFLKSPGLRRYDAIYWTFDNGTISLVGRYADVMNTLARYGLVCRHRINPCATDQ